MPYLCHPVLYFFNPANLKGKANPDLPSVCSNYWPPNVALSLCNHLVIEFNIQYRNFVCLWSNLIFRSSSVISDSSDFGLCLRFLSVLTFLLTSNFVVTFRLLIWDFAIEKILLIPPPPPTSAPNFALKNTLMIQWNIAVKIGGFQSYIFVSMSQFRHFPRYTFTWKLIYNFGDHLIMRNSLVQSLKNKT